MTIDCDPFSAPIRFDRDELRVECIDSFAVRGPQRLVRRRAA